MRTVNPTYDTNLVKVWFSNFITEIRSFMAPVIGSYTMETDIGTSTTPAIFVSPPMRPADYDVEGVECIIWHPDINTLTLTGRTQINLEVTIELRQWDETKTLLNDKLHLLKFLEGYNVDISSVPPSFLGGGQIVESAKFRITHRLAG